MLGNALLVLAIITAAFVLTRTRQAAAVQPAATPPATRPGEPPDPTLDPVAADLDKRKRYLGQITADLKVFEADAQAVQAAAVELAKPVSDLHVSANFGGPLQKAQTAWEALMAKIKHAAELENTTPNQDTGVLLDYTLRATKAEAEFGTAADALRAMDQSGRDEIVNKKSAAHSYLKPDSTRKTKCCKHSCCSPGEYDVGRERSSCVGAHRYHCRTDNREAQKNIDNINSITQKLTSTLDKTQTLLKTAAASAGRLSQSARDLAHYIKGL